MNAPDAVADGRALGGPQPRPHRGEVIAIRIVNRREASPEERARYLEAGLLTEAGLEEATRLLTFKAALEKRESVKRGLAERVRELEAHRAVVHADLISYLSDESCVRPPRERGLATFKARAGRLFDLLPYDSSSNEILTLALDLLDRWRYTRVELSPCARHPVACGSGSGAG